jgi:hypothetical protein
VLHYLVDHAGQLVTKEILLEAELSAGQWEIDEALSLGGRSYAWAADLIADPGQSRRPLYAWVVGHCLLSKPQHHAERVISINHQ